MCEHDEWANRIEITRAEEDSFRIRGWLPVRPNEGDKLIYEVAGDRKAVGYIVNVKYMRDPQDMFFADVIPYDFCELTNG